MSNPATNLQYLVYGKIIIDNIRLANGEIARGIVGGGGPQGAFGARLWNESVGFLSRSGTDIEAQYVRALESIDVDLTGWARYPDIATFRNVLMAYDENEYATRAQDNLDAAALQNATTLYKENWDRMMAQVLPLPEAYCHPRAIHLISEYPREPMVQTARELRAQGAIFSLEPIIDYREWSNREAMLELMPHVDVVSPDWPSASGFAGSTEPLEVVKYWSKLGPKMVSVRHGANGSYVWDQEHDQIWQIPPVTVPVVDVTGAGNGYSGGLCVGWAENEDARVAGSYGAVSASLMVERVGLPEMTEALQSKAIDWLERALTAARRL